MSEARTEPFQSVNFDEMRPKGWIITSIGELAEVNPSKATLKLDDRDLVSFIPMVAVEPLSNVIDVSHTRAFGEVKKNFTRFIENDILFAKITPCMENGKVAIARGLHEGRGCGTTEFHVLRPSNVLNPKYLFYFVIRDAFRNEAKRNMSGAVGQQRVPADFVRDAEFPLAPLTEQKRIVSKVDELFSEIEAGERALKRARAALARYRKSVLKAAVTGDLTADWREANKDKLEPAEKLLTRILTARRDAWEKSERAKLKAQGKTPKGGEWKKKYKEPTTATAAAPFDLPESWGWASIDQIADIIGGVTVDRKRTPRDPVTVPYLRVANVQRGYLDLAEIKEITVEREKAEQTSLQYGDILFNEGGDIDKLGRGWIWESQLNDCIHQNHVFRARLINKEFAPKFFSWYANVLGADYFLTEGKQTTNLASISMTKLKALPVPLPPVLEQSEIVSRVEEILSKADHVEAALDEQKRAARALQQSILKAAFEGRLVPQDPADEPAAKLLERIKRSRR